MSAEEPAVGAEVASENAEQPVVPKLDVPPTEAAQKALAEAGAEAKAEEPATAEQADGEEPAEEPREVVEEGDQPVGENEEGDAEQKPLTDEEKAAFEEEGTSEAATKIQAQWRAKQAREKVQAMKEGKAAAEEDGAAAAPAEEGVMEEGPTPQPVQEAEVAEPPELTDAERAELAGEDTDAAATRIQAQWRAKQARAKVGEMKEAAAAAEEPEEVIIPLVDPEIVRLRGILEDAKSEASGLRAHNIHLMKQVIAVLENTTIAEALGVEVPKNFKSLDSIPQQYSEKLQEISRAHDLYAKKQEDSNNRIRKLNAKVVAEDEKADELRNAYKQFKRDVAREALNLRTNRAIPAKWILQKEQEEEEMDQEVEARRLKNIHFEIQMGKLQQQLKDNEQLAEGLHMFDFEQLKIENQTLNEKIEERNDEIHKLQKKTDTTVQVLTHVKEKLQFVTVDTRELQGELKELDTEATGERDALTKLKRRRDTLRRANMKLKQKQGFVGNDNLVSDYESRKERIEDMEREIVELKVQYHKMKTILRRGQDAEIQMNLMSDQAQQGPVLVETPFSVTM